MDWSCCCYSCHTAGLIPDSEFCPPGLQMVQGGGGGGGGGRGQSGRGLLGDVNKEIKQRSLPPLGNAPSLLYSSH